MNAKGKYLIWYTNDYGYTFEIVDSEKKITNIIYKRKIDKNGFSINMVGNVTQAWINDPIVYFEGERVDLSYDNCGAKYYLDEINSPNLLKFKQYVIDHLNKILDEWI